jgi:ribosomal protein S18 acetylase RimI-like enzyme
MHAYKAIHHDRIIGGAVAFPTRQGQLYVNALFVANQFRGMGVGESLLSAILEDAGDRDILLDTWVFNRKAKRLFEKLGFVPDRALLDYYEEGIDYILLSRRRPSR